MKKCLFLFGTFVVFGSQFLLSMELPSESDVSKKRKFNQFSESIAPLVAGFNTFTLNQQSPSKSPAKNKVQKTFKSQGPSFHDAGVPKAPRHAAPLSRRNPNAMDDGSKLPACKNLFK